MIRQQTDKSDKQQINEGKERNKERQGQTVHRTEIIENSDKQKNIMKSGKQIYIQNKDKLSIEATKYDQANN